MTTASEAEPAAPATALSAWEELMETVADCGRLVAADSMPEVDVAEGLRYVLTALGDQLDRAAIRHSSKPAFLAGVTPVRKLFFDNPDTDYDTAFIRGDRTYRIRGRRGTCHYLAFCVYAGNTNAGEPTRVINVNDTHLQLDADGTFELVLSAAPQPGNWVRLDPDAHLLIARQYHLDRAQETPATYEIELIDEPAPDPVLDAATFANAARQSAAAVRMATELARTRSMSVPTPNTFFPSPGHGVYGTPDADYVVCWYQLGPGESLVIDVTPPACRYWGVHLANRWGQSLDHRTRRTVLNAATATPEADGSYRFVLASEDPGEPNWLDIADHPGGWALFRWLLSDGVALPTTRVI